MTTSENQSMFTRQRHYGERHRNNRIGIGLTIIIAGLVIFAQRAGFFHLHISLWPFALIIIGLFIGIRHKFRHLGAWILLAIGTANLIPHFFIGSVSSHQLIAPFVLIAIGIFMIFKPKGSWHHHRHLRTTGILTDDQLDMQVSFGERRTIVTSRNFKGANISNSFGTTLLNLLQADSTETMIIDMQVSFGSVEIIVPSHWDVQIDIQPTLGSVEDKRFIHTSPGSERRLLILKGSCTFGSVEVKSA